MTHFPADPGTWLIALDEDVEPIPILGWSHTTAGDRAWPVFPYLKKGLLSGEAIRFPTGAVVDPVWRKTFGSEEAWRLAFHEEEPYEPGVTPGESKASTAPAKTERPANTSGVQVEEIDVGLTLGKKTYKNKSWWRFTDEDMEEDFVFEVEGGELTPKDERATKITRADFYELRKELPVKVIVEGAGEPQTDDEDEEDDDLEGLV